MSESVPKSENNDMPLWERKGYVSEAEYEKSKAQQLIRISEKLIKRAEKVGILSSVPYEKGDVSITHHQTNESNIESRTSTSNSIGLHKRGDDINAGVHKTVREHPQGGGAIEKNIGVYTEEGGSKLVGRIKQPSRPSFKKEQIELTLDQSVSSAAKMLNRMRSDIAQTEIEQKEKNKQKEKENSSTVNDLLNA